MDFGSLKQKCGRGKDREESESKSWNFEMHTLNIARHKLDLASRYCDDRDLLLFLASKKS